MNEKLAAIKRALDESRRQYEYLVDTIPDLVFSLSADGRFIAVNNEFISSIGYRKEEVLGVPFAALIHPDDRQRYFAAFKQALQSHGPVKGIEIRLITKRGEISHFEINQSSIYGMDGELTCIQGVAHDVSERKRAEERIQRLKELNETVLNSIRRGLAVVDARTHRIVTANKIFLRELELTEEETLDRNVYDLRPGRGLPYSWERWLSVLNETLLSGETKEIEQLHEVNGEPRYVELSAYPIKNQQNEVTGVVMINRDVTERRKIEEELKKRVSELSFLKEVSEALQSTLKLEEILYIILVGATAGQGLGFNRAFLLLYDDEKEVVEGKLAIGPSGAEEAGHIWADLERKKLSLSELLRSYNERALSRDVLVNRIVRKIRIPVAEADNILVKSLLEGRAFNVHGGLVEGEPELEVGADLISLLGVDSFAVVPLYSSDKKIGLLIADNMINRRPITNEDLDSLRIFANHASSAIENSRLYGELEEKVRDLERAHALIQQKQTELLEAERLSTIGRMAAVLAHEIRNPLVSIGGFARSLMQEVPEDNQMREELSIIVSEVIRLEELLKDVLEYAKFAKPRPKPVDLGQLIRQVLELLKYEMRSRNIDTKLELYENLGPILADENQLRQVLINLIFNAIHAMPGGGRLSIHASPDGRYAELRIADTGVGIPPEHLDKLFTPFFTTKSMGVGIGLNLVWQIVNEHGGSISVQSEKGRGTTFIIYLPLALVDPEEGGLDGNDFDRR